MPDPAAAIEGVDDLYRLEPGAFVAARDELAKRLRQGGDRDAAAEVKGLKRPTRVAWALNQIARRQPGEIERLLQAGATIAEVQAEVLRGGDPARLRAATRERRALVSALAAAAAELAGPAHHDEAAATLEGASVDEEVGAALRAGRVSREAAATSGFGLPGMPEVDDTPTPKPDPTEVERRRLALERADGALTIAGDRLRQAEARLAEAQRAVAAAEAAAEEARAEQQAAAAVLAELEGG